MEGVEYIGDGMDSQVFRVGNSCMKLYEPHIDADLLRKYHEIHHILSRLGKQSLRICDYVNCKANSETGLVDNILRNGGVLFGWFLITRIIWSVVDLGEIVPYTRGIPADPIRGHVFDNLRWEPGGLVTYPPYIEWAVLSEWPRVRSEEVSAVCTLLEYALRDYLNYVEEVPGPVNIKIKSIADGNMEVVITDLWSSIQRFMGTVDIEKVKNIFSERTDRVFV